MAREHNELSQVTVTAEPFDTNNLPYTPISARYKVTDCKSESTMVDWTILTPAEAMEIIVPGTVNTIVNDSNRIEHKVVTVNTDKDLTTQHYEEYQYTVKNLKFV